MQTAPRLLRHKLGLGLALGLALTGCAGLGTPPPPRQHYALTAEHPPAQAAPAGAPVIAVQTLQAAPRAGGEGFLYRRTEEEYVSDYYHVWVSPPAPILSQNLREWLAASGLFAYVTPGVGYAQPGYVLEGSLLSLYGDYRNPQAPLAVLAVEFALLQDQPAGMNLRLRRHYQETEPLPQANPTALAAAWRVAWTRLLQRLEQDIVRCLHQQACS